MRRLQPAIQRLVAILCIGLAAAAVVLLVVAASSPGSECTFDNVTCRRNELLGIGLRCLIAGVVAGLVWAWLRRRLRRPR